MVNEEERKMKENVQLEKMEMEKKLKIKIQGFEEFLENKKVSNISRNSFAVYNVNWLMFVVVLKNTTINLKKIFSNKLVTWDLLSMKKKL